MLPPSGVLCKCPPEVPLKHTDSETQQLKDKKKCNLQGEVMS